LEDSTVLTLTAAGREISLASITDIRSVTDAWWPYHSELADADWPPNRVRGFRTTYKDGALLLLLTSKHGGRPQIGDELRIWYTRRHTVEGFQGAALTTLTAEAETLVTTGAAGLAALAGALDHSLPVGWERVSEWASAWIKIFERGLDELASRETRICGEPWGEGWQLDRWDELPTAG
jgi:hypothetical protein